MDPARELIVLGVILVTMLLIYLSVNTRVKLLGIIATVFSLAVAINIVSENPTAIGANLAALGFAALGFWSAYYSVFGKD